MLATLQTFWYVAGKFYFHFYQKGIVLASSSFLCSIVGWPNPSCSRIYTSYYYLSRLYGKVSFFPPFQTKFIEGSHSVQPTLRRGALWFTSLREEYLHKLFKFFYIKIYFFSHLIYLFKHLFIWVWTHGYLLYT